ncbi:MAG: hypothetical protein IJV24_09560 [Prevotella sp.]|nr:hypothetical protein [Prevotella sp.]
MMMKKILLAIAALTCFCMQMQAETIPIDAEHFPDSVFRNYVLTQMQYMKSITVQPLVGEDGKLSDYERKHVKQIIIPEGCKSVEGIQYFSECEVEHQHIRLYSTDLTTLDLSGMQMSDFYAEGMRLESLNLQGCEKLEVLFCQQNRLTTLNLQGCTSLRSIKCYDNQLTSLNLSRATALKYLHCHNNQIEILSITSPSIQTINCSYNPLTALFLPTITYNATTLLTDLDCRHTQLTTLDLGDNRYNRVECSSSPINGITWSSAGNGSVKQLYCDSTKVSGEDLSAIPHPEDLSYLSCRNCGISSIDVSRMTSLERFDCDYNKLTTIDLSHNAALWYGYFYGNQLYALDVTPTRISNLSNCIQYLEGQAVDIDGGLYVRLNSEVNVDSIFNLSYHVYNTGRYKISKPLMRGEYLLINMDGIDFDKVHYSYHAGNGTTLRVNINTGAKGVGINEYNFPDERFRRYLLSQSYGRDSLLTDDEIAAITKLDISGKSIVSLEGIHYLNNLSDLNCSSNNLTSDGFQPVVWLANLTHLEFSQNAGITSFDASRLTKLRWLVGWECGLSSLNLTGCNELTTLSIEDNQLTELDLTSNVRLQSVSCDNNQLTAIRGLNQLADLRTLGCPNNRLDSIDVATLTMLSSLSCGNNNLTELDLSGAGNIKYLYAEKNRLTAVSLPDYCLLREVRLYANQLKGDAMQAIAQALPQRTSTANLRAYYQGYATEGNVMTTRVVDYLKEKGWTPQYTTNGYTWIDYEGEPMEYDLWVNGTRVTTANCNDIENLTRYDQGRISYDEMTNTLTLDSAYIGSTAAYAIRDSIPGLTIKLNGESTFNMSKGGGLDAYCDVTITGPGKVTFKTDNNAIDLSWNDNTLTVKGGAEVIADASEATSSDSYGISGFTRDGLIGESEAACVGTLNVEGNGTVVKAIGKKVSIGQLKALTYPAGASLLVGSQDGTNTTQGYFVNNNVCISSGTGRVDRIYLPAKNLWVTLTCPTYVRGDVNMDGTVDAADLTALAGIIVGTAADTELSDVNEDGGVTIADLTALVGLLVSGN